MKFEKIPEILDAEKIIERALNKSKKVKIVDRNRDYRIKKTIIAKTESFSKNIIDLLEKYVKEFPSIDQLPRFYQELIDIKIDVNKLRKALGGINWAFKTCQMIYNKQSRFLKKSKNQDFLKQKQSEIYGRISSVVRQINNELLLVENARRILKKFPDVNDIPTVVIAGFPNVGKSSLLRCLSKAKPKIATYPFTTKEIHVGHLETTEHYVKKRIQIIDTPGLLDRLDCIRNDIERQAIAALSYLADIIVFVVDPSETCGYSYTDQKHLLEQLKETFKESDFIVVENKSDVKKTNSKNLKISCENKQGINMLLDQINGYFKEK